MSGPTKDILLECQGQWKHTNEATFNRNCLSVSTTLGESRNKMAENRLDGRGPAEGPEVLRAPFQFQIICREEREVYDSAEISLYGLSCEEI